MPKEKTRPDSLPSETTKVETHEGHFYVTITYKRKRPFEVFGALGKSNICEKAWVEALSRSISVGLRHGVPARAYVEQLRGIECNPFPDEDGFVGSPADGIAKVLKSSLEKRGLWT